MTSRSGDPRDGQGRDPSACEGAGRTDAGNGQPSPRGVPARAGKTAIRMCEAAYPYRCCVVCGLTQDVLDVAHLDQDRSNDDPDNLAFLCKTHHWMLDVGLYPIAAIKLMRDHWRETRGAVDHAARMKEAGARAGQTRKRSAAAKRAAATRALNESDSGDPSEPPDFEQMTDTKTGWREFARWRRAVGLSFRWAGRALGVTDRHVRRYERGDSPVSSAIAAKARDVYGRAQRGEAIEGAGSYARAGRPRPKNNGPRR